MRARCRDGRGHRPSIAVAAGGLLVALLMMAGAGPGLAQEETELAKKTQNPVADLISVPFQSNFNFGVGPGNDLQYILNIQPVVPFRLTGDWNLISRTIVPLIDQPELAPGVGDVFGLGDIQLSLFLSPARPGAVIWGLGPVFQFPSATDDALGAGKWAAGPTGACGSSSSSSSRGDGQATRALDRRSPGWGTGLSGSPGWPGRRRGG